MRVLAAAGGSGGHCYPAIAFLQACRRRHPDWSLTLAVDRGVRTLGLEIEASAADKVVEVESAGFAGLRSLIDPAFWGKLMRGSAQAGALLKDFRPNLVVGFGGFGSFPTVWAAESRGVRVIVHEQNAVMGLANRILAVRADRIAGSLPIRRLPAGVRSERIVHTGFPLRGTLKKLDAARVKARFGLDPALKTLLVFGGSQGSAFINRLIGTVLKDHGETLKSSWQVLHLTGRNVPGPEMVAEQATGPFRRWAYSREMDALYTASDLVVCRAGSATLHELAHYGKASVLIPYPHARGHQVENARALSDRGAARLLEEKNASPKALMDLLAHAASDPDELARMGRRCAELLQKDGADALVDLAEKMTEK